jgi:hypothetical protein
MFAWMALAAELFFRPTPEADSPLFWFMMQIGLMVGFATTLPGEPLAGPRRCQVWDVTPRWRPVVAAPTRRQTAGRSGACGGIGGPSDMGRQRRTRAASASCRISNP